MESKQFVLTAWNAVMDETQNPLRRFPLMTAHMLMQILAWMWSAIFSLAIGSYFVFGVTMVGHSLFIAGLVVTLAVFRRAEARQEHR
ncbi:hypothetical protein DDZ14_06340 [Maritimibacter sp. 55A14]|nr:hypothetical protein DDZ14_06340 [Maritimibacter sp. 55A14]